MINCGIFGPKLSGKSTLAHKLSKELFAKQGMKSMVLDPHPEDWPLWGEQATVTNDEDAFWPAVWKSQNCAVFVEEAASTINRDKSLIEIFTRMRHCGHKLIVIGHNGMSLLPIMREQIDTVYLFRLPNSACKVWAEVMTNELLYQAKDLKQFEFIYHHNFGPTLKQKLAPPKNV